MFEKLKIILKYNTNVKYQIYNYIYYYEADVIYL